MVKAVKEMDQEVDEEGLDEEMDPEQEGAGEEDFEQENERACKECGDELAAAKKLVKKVGGADYNFCSQRCVNEFLKHFG